MADTNELMIKKAKRIENAMEIEKRRLIDTGNLIASQALHDFLFDAPTASKARLYDIIMDIKEG